MQKDARSPHATAEDAAVNVSHESLSRSSSAPNELVAPRRRAMGPSSQSHTTEPYRREVQPSQPAKPLLSRTREATRPIRSAAAKPRLRVIASNDCKRV